VDNPAGLVNEVGAADGLSSPSNGRVFTLQVTAVGFGSTTVTSNKGESTLSQIVVFGSDEDQRDLTDYGTLQLDIAPAQVSGRWIFYNNSFYDSNSAAANSADDNAIAPSPRDLGETGTHRGLDNQAVLTDTAQSWTAGAWIGKEIINLTDGSRGSVTANTATTITVTLSGGAENDWDIGDEYLLVGLGKTALLPGQTATFANYTSYSRGINGIMIDIAGLPAGTALTLDDFVFRVGNDDTPDGWPTAPDPILAGGQIPIRRGAGVNGSDRVTLIWADDDWRTSGREPGSISNQWLQVTVLATAATGLSAPDVFYFGNAMGETGNSSANTFVNSTDAVGVRYNPHNFLDPAPIEDVYDFDRDARVNSTDAVIVRYNSTNFTNALKLITAPGRSAGSSSVEARDTIFRGVAGGDWDRVVAVYEAWHQMQHARQAAKTTKSGQLIDAVLATGFLENLTQ
jgi:hypothetical protein